MKVAVKECGGCNSRLDKKALINLIKEKLVNKGVDFVPFTSPEYDVLISISGCHVNCAAKNASEFMPDGVTLIVVHEYIVDGIYTMNIEEMSEIIVSKILKLKEKVLKANEA
ncbi:MAG TPA: hypothetical protein GXX38_07960 [Clostridia bacterium]|jgi:uncharacterized metal-binding protein|nr:hypothetical protein [Clostridia bacterium]